MRLPSGWNKKWYKESWVTPKLFMWWSGNKNRNQWISSYISMHTYVCMYVCVCIYIYIYIYNPTDRTYNWKVLLRSLFFDEVLFIVVVLSLSHIWLFVTPRTAACQASLSLTVSRSLLKLTSILLVSLSWWYHPTISCSVARFFCLQSFPASWSFPTSWLFVSGGQRIGASASVLPKSSQGWFPLG